MSSSPAVSVIIPTHNRREILLETLASVFAQSFRDLEVIVVDDGSSDGTAASLEPLAEAGRLRRVGGPGRGPAAARNRGIEHARGEFLALLDDDDLWPPDKLSWQVEVLRGEPEALLVYGFMESFGLEGSWRWPPPDGPTGQVRRPFLRKNWIRSPGQTLIRRSAVEQAGIFDESVWSADDWDLYLRLARIGPFVYRNQLALRYRAHPGNLSRRAWRMFRNAWRVHSRHAGAFPRRGEIALWLACRATMLNTLQRDLRPRRG